MFLFICVQKPNMSFMTIRPSIVATLLMWKLDHGIDGKYPTHGKLERFFMIPSDTKFCSSSSTKDFWLACSDFHLF